MRTFKVTLGEEEPGFVARVPLPFDPRVEFGKARAPVKITVNRVVLRSTVMIYGGKAYIGFRREICEQAKLRPGKTVTIRIESDTAPREVEIPPDLERALRADRAARAAWDALSFTHRKEHAEALLGAKKAETRASRLEKTVAMLRAPKRAAKVSARAQ